MLHAWKRRNRGSPVVWPPGYLRMTSPASRSSDPNAPLHPFVVAHHRVGARDHCYRLRVAGRPWFLCARCLGILLAFVPLLALHAAGVIAWFQWSPALALLGLPAPAVVDWSLGRLGLRDGSNPVRTLTGLLLGAGQAAFYTILFTDTFNPWLWISAAVHGGVVAAVHFGTRFSARLVRGQERSG